MDQEERPRLRARRWLVVGGPVLLALVVGFGFAVILSGVLGAPGNGERAGVDATCVGDALVGRVSVATVVARKKPDRVAAEVGTFHRMTPFGTPEVFLLDGEVAGTDGGSWYRVLLPEPPNGSTGFIPKDSVRLSTSPFRLVVDRRALRLTVFRRCEPIATYPVAVGKPSTPTPVGSFYLTGLFKPVPNSPLGPFAYSLSAHSEVLTSWRFGGIVGLHGTNDSSSIGRPVTHGCIRVQNEVMERLAGMLPVGTPIEIV